MIKYLMVIKLKNKIKKYIPEILAFTIPIIIMLISCIINKVYPFGNIALPRYDGYYQYAGFTTYFKNVLINEESLFYSFKGILGYNYYATAIYYMFNPTNLLCIFSTNETILEYYTFIIFLRIGLSGLTMCKYLKYKFKNQSNLKYIIFSISYALIAYNVCYFFNYMYFDTVVLFPITMIGLEKLIHERKNKLYIISLTISIISNFYIGYMVCIFSLLYFVYNIFIYKLDKKIIKDFIISSLLSGLICALIIIPEASELLKGKALLYNDSAQTEYFKFNTNFLNIFYKSFPGSTYNYDLKYGTVNIYVSLLVIVLVIKYFFNKKISKKEKKATLIFILFFLLSISFNLIDYAWHLFQRPIWYPNRYIFTFSFFLITIAMKSIVNNEYKPNIKRNIIISTSLILLSIYPAIKMQFYLNNLKIVSYILGIILILQYTFLLDIKQSKKLITLLFIIEITFNTIVTLSIMAYSANMTYYKNNTNINNKAINYIKKIDNEENNFYRMEISQGTVYNSPSLYNYNGINHFNSVRNAKSLNFLKNFNYDVSDETTITFNNYNPYITSILGIKYIQGSDNELLYEKVYNDNPYIYLNKDALNIGYMIYNKDYKLTNSSYQNTENLINSMLNTNYNRYEIIDNYKGNYEIITKNNKKYIKSNKPIELEINNKSNTNILLIPSRNMSYVGSYSLYINNKEIKNTASLTMPIYVNKNDHYKIIFRSNLTEIEYNKLRWYIIDYDKYIDSINELKSNQLNITNYKKDNYIEGNINVNNDKNILLLTIPYDKGWNIKVDNKDIKYDICFDTFICLELEKGNHNITMKYIPSGLIIGLIISSITFILTIIYTRKK